MTARRNELYVKLKRVFGARVAYKITVRVIK